MESVGIIGFGRMGRCLTQGLVEAGVLRPEQVFFTRKHPNPSENPPESALSAAQPLKANSDLLKKSKIIVLSVKPQNLDEVLSEIRGGLTEKHLLISILAGTSTQQIEEKVKKKIPIIRAMPNIPTFVREGMTAYCLGSYALENHGDFAKKIFGSVGKVVRVEEKHMDSVTGLSGCGPAFMFLCLEALTDAGIKVGLPREISSLLSAQTMLGSARMLLETGEHPAKLRDEVTTPAGCTIDGLLELEEGKLRVTLIKAVVQATLRSKNLRTG